MIIIINANRTACQCGTGKGYHISWTYAGTVFNRSLRFCIRAVYHRSGEDWNFARQWPQLAVLW